ncbi:MAG: threonylcarbamoyl-AMP synthase [Thermoplasmatales archaeon]|nr:MAG: threonylcarbamoyl-AMP synthase [Thermoplasmatales archaeon]
MNKIDFSEIVKTLQKGKAIVYPTDTLYALGGDIFNEEAVERIFEIIKRPLNIPLPVAVSSLDDIDKIAFIDDSAECLAKKFLPGAITLILNKKDCIPDIVTGNLDKVAIRVPDNKFALELLHVFGPLTVTSANIHGKETPHVINEIETQFKAGDIAIYLNHGKLNGKPSTIVDLTLDNIKIIREGAISKKNILDAL